MQLLGRDQRKAIGQIEAHLMAEDRERARAGPVTFLVALVENAAQKRVILLHGTPRYADLNLPGRPGEHAGKPIHKTLLHKTLRPACPRPCRMRQSYRYGLRRRGVLAIR